eukprot:366135-Chlamydomonas_euryale.AAC.4
MAALHGGTAWRHSGKICPGKACGESLPPPPRMAAWRHCMAARVRRALAKHVGGVGSPPPTPRMAAWRHRSKAMRSLWMLLSGMTA